MADTNTAIASINSLGAGLLGTVHQTPVAGALGDKPAGTFVSPVSISLALVLLLNGANEGSPVHQQLQQVLAKPTEDECITVTHVNQQYEDLLQQLEAAVSSGAEGSEGDDAPLTLSIATSVWARPPLEFQRGYLSAIKEHLKSSAHALTGAAPVNDWVSAETRGKIADLLDEGSVAKAVAVLVSAVYFKGTWEHAFDGATTNALPFHLGSGGDVHAAMMHKKFSIGQAAYTREEGQYEGVRLPYKGQKYAAVALLPDAGAPGGAAGLLRRISEESGFVKGMRWGRGEVLVWLPRFKLESQMKLKGPLQKLGVTAAFQPSRDFGKMLEGESELLVDEVVHKVFIEVNEKGTEAAAATAVLMMRCAMPLRPPPELRFDRPFVFGVQHVPTGTLLFVGVVEQPELWQDS